MVILKNAFILVRSRVTTMVGVYTFLTYNTENMPSDLLNVSYAVLNRVLKARNILFSENLSKSAATTPT